MYGDVLQLERALDGLSNTFGFTTPGEAGAVMFVWFSVSVTAVSPLCCGSPSNAAPGVVY